MKMTRRSISVVGLAAAFAVSLAACSSSQGGKQEEEQADGGSNVGVAKTPQVTIAMVTHAAPGDTFWDQVRDGALAAAAKDNVKLVYSNDPQGPAQATLVQNAVDQKVDGIAVTLAKPDAMKGAVQNARKAGIPVVALNAGMDAWQDTGAQMFFGQDDEIAGEAAGERLNEDGAKNVLCVIQEQGHVGLEARCAGLQKTFDGKSEILYVNGQDMPSVRTTISNKLDTTAGIDHVVMLGAPFAMTAIDSVADAGSDAKVVTFDLNEDAVKAIQDGEIGWAINQQPFVQGYLSVDSLWLYINRGASVGGGKPVLTGPSFVDDSNVDTVAEQF
ncbi:MAG TPA: substrate-binding domain-containing protein [Nocardioidaceae bacterium]|jgi:simple sugar transport system substrate-binding protein|nr:substrate-binding domain-containing protein [Nocardioidaceae bacterium]